MGVLLYSLVLAGSQGAAVPPVVAPQIPPPPPVIYTPALLPPPPAPLPSPPTARSASPRGNPGLWVTSNDYPSRALREERQGTTSFRAIIGPDGRVTGCEITASSGSPDLDAATCSLITRRARFNPALDDAGNPTTGTFSSRVRWAIPEDDPVTLPQEGSLTISIIVARDGSTSDCRVMRSSGGFAYARPVGPTYCADFVYASAYRDRRGRRIARTVSITRTIAIRGVPAVQPVLPAVETDLRRSSLEPPRAGTIVRSYVVEADGRQTECRVESVIGAASIQFRSGTRDCDVDRFASVFLGGNGQPERRQVVETTTVAYVTRR